jgi:hypothetical protein
MISEPSRRLRGQPLLEWSILMTVIAPSQGAA